MKKSFEIESDCLGIVERMKSIDKDYFVLFDLDKQKFELDNHAQGKFTYCLTFPYEQLDERAYLLTLKTRVQNSDKLYKEMEEENRRLEKQKIKEVLNDFKEKMYDS